MTADRILHDTADWTAIRIFNETAGRMSNETAD